MEGSILLELPLRAGHWAEVPHLPAYFCLFASEPRFLWIKEWNWMPGFFECDALVVSEREVGCVSRTVGYHVVWEREPLVGKSKLDPRCEMDVPPSTG